jgi:hypothetical protein
MIIPAHIQTSLVSIGVTQTLGHHMLIFFGPGCDTRRVLEKIAVALVNKTESILKAHSVNVRLLPIALIVETLDRSPDVLTVIDSIVRDDPITFVPKPRHFSVISRMLADDDNERAMALQ